MWAQKLVLNLFLFTAFILTIGCGGSKKLIEGYKNDLKSDNVEIRRKAAENLRALGSDADKAEKELIAAMKDKDPIVRRYAIEILGDIKPNMSIEFNTVFIWLLNDHDLDVRRAAVVAAGKLTNYPGNIVNTLQRRLADPDRLIREFTMSAFERIGKFGVQALTRALKDPEVKMRLAAVQTLGRLGPDASKAHENVKLTSTQDEDQEVREAAIHALQFIPQDLSPENPELLNASDETKPENKEEAENVTPEELLEAVTSPPPEE